MKKMTLACRSRKRALVLLQTSGSQALKPDPRTAHVRAPRGEACRHGAGCSGLRRGITMSFHANRYAP
jgi:hypothetical protein